ncbi:hypothetical protein [Arcobacter aquimarinus]|uniref:Membrane protein n=1 Tax=Arcobacter aquimarinus TaxID=1315211 RepID=A0AAE7E0Q0_9BACT|nr:hypothetical protein [Arcobacter aquimarinus]QKE25087.1 putative membrane protein [Arcobacter aquimarinus]RXI36460.1 hypothetical protein CP986_02530 [Arcobacter aquimarinus]
MFTKESLYINAIKYDSQLKLEHKKLKNEEIIETNNSSHLVDDDILPLEIAEKINKLQEEIDLSYISTLLISDTTKLVPKALSSKLTDCEIAKFNNEFDIAVLKTTLFETKNYFVKTGIDYIYSAFHIMNLHIEKKVCRNELLILLYNNKAFIMILNKSGIIAFHETVDLPTFESVKKTHFYEDDLEGQKLFDEIYYLELNEIIHKILDEFYSKKNDVFVEKVSILYVVKQLTNENIEQLSEDLMLKVEHQPINVDEEIFELSRDKHLKKSFIKPRKKKKKRDFKYLYFILLIAVLVFGAYKIYTMIDFDKFFPKKENNKIEVVKEKPFTTILPDHVNMNDKIEQRIKAIFNTIPNNMMINELSINSNYLELKMFSKNLESLNQLKSSLDTLYKQSEFNIIKSNEDKDIDFVVLLKDEIDLPIEYKKFDKEYIVDEVIPVERVTEQLKILMPENTLIKFVSNNINGIVRFTYTINILVKEPKEFFNLLEILNSELYSINILYPVSMVNTAAGIEVEFNLEFNQLENYKVD